MGFPYIPEVENAKRIYSVKHFRYPIDVVNHENKLEDKGHYVSVRDRQTCRHCKQFKDPEHIENHHNNRSNVMSLFDEEKS